MTVSDPVAEGAMMPSRLRYCAASPMAWQGAGSFGHQFDVGQADCGTRGWVAKVHQSD
jgi:hypothetical protein